MYPHPSAPSMDDDNRYCCCNNNVNRAFPASSCPQCFDRPPHRPPPGRFPPFPGHHGPPPPPDHHPPPPFHRPMPPHGPSYPPFYPNPRPPTYPTYPNPMPQPVVPPSYTPTPNPRPPASNSLAYYWVDTHARGLVPTTAIRGGHDSDGEAIYVGRAYHEGDWIPAKVIPGKNVAYVAYNGEEHAKDQYQVLCEQRFDWVHNHGGYIPPGAVEGGRTSDGETLYIGRANHEGSLTVGKVHPSHGCLYIPYGGREHPHQSYEILVLRS